jgi:hypothetical protein
VYPPAVAIVSIFMKYTSPLPPAAAGIRNLALVRLAENFESVGPSAWSQSYSLSVSSLGSKGTGKRTGTSLLPQQRYTLYVLNADMLGEFPLSFQVIVTVVLPVHSVLDVGDVISTSAVASPTIENAVRAAVKNELERIVTRADWK